MADGTVEIGIELDDSSVRGDAKKAGKEAGEEFAEGFEKGSSKGKEPIGDEGGKAGKAYGEKFSSKAKAGFSTLAPAAAAAGAAATAALVKEAVDAYAQYEQLVGGVAKIFDEMDNERILRDANNAYIDLNMSANDYLAAINQTGAAFASTMGDEAGYDTARRGMLAIADYASGTGRNLDELNEKYMLITRSTASYQSIADQFSGILPATSVAFLEQAQAAGYLGEQYTQLTQVPMEEYQSAVTSMLEQGVGALNLTGNTAAEATQTLSGSLAMLASQWENWLTSLAGTDEQVEAATQALVDAAAIAAQNILPVIGTVLVNLASALADGLRNMLESAVEQLLAGNMQIGEAAFEAFISIVTAINEMITLAVDAIVLLLVGVIAAILDRAKEFFNAGAELVVEIASGIAKRASRVVSSVKSAITDAIDEAKDMASRFVSVGKEFVNGIVAGIKEKARSMVNAAVNAAKDAVRAVKDWLGIASPSKRMRDEVGRYMAEGVGEGFDKYNPMRQIEQSLQLGIAGTRLQLAGAGAGASNTTQTFIIERIEANDLSGISAVEQLIELFERNA